MQTKLNVIDKQENEWPLRRLASLLDHFWSLGLSNVKKGTQDCHRLRLSLIAGTVVVMNARREESFLISHINRIYRPKDNCFTEFRSV